MTAIALAERRETAIDPAMVEQVLLKGDLRGLTATQKIGYYKSVCESVGLNPLTQPFAYIVLNGKEVLYAKKDATEQLRKIHNISIDPKNFTREVIEGVYVVTAAASMPNGRTDVSTGAVAIDGLKGESRANAMLKAETKAKRRVTLSICGMGMLDETEVESIPNVSVPVEAPPKRVTLPPGAVQILSVLPRSRGQASWADVTFVDEHGVEKTLPTPADSKEGSPLTLFTEWVQEACPVVLEIGIGPRNGKERIENAAKWREQPTEKPPVMTADQIPF